VPSLVLKVDCFRYILEILQPGPKAVISVLEILTRIVRHSHDSALAVTCCPRLLSVIINNFVPRDWRGIGLYQLTDNMTVNSIIGMHGSPICDMSGLFSSCIDCY
jgi:hypothetical protein